MSIAASDSNSNMIPHDLGSNHGHCFTLSRVHLSFEKISAESHQIGSWFPISLKTVFISKKEM